METFSPFLPSLFFVVAWQFEADCFCLLLIIFNYLSLSLLSNILFDVS